MAETRNTRKRAAPKARATSTASTTRRKPRARASAQADTTAKATPPRPAAKLQAAARDLAHAQLGLAAQVVETVAIRVIQARAEAPRQWEGLVKRGEKVRRELEQAGEGLRQDIRSRAASFSPRTEVEARIAKARTLLGMFGRRRAAA